jgi:hypothetical protein
LEGHASFTPVACASVYLYLIDEHKTELIALCCVTPTPSGGNKKGEAVEPRLQESYELSLVAGSSSGCLLLSHYIYPSTAFFEGDSAVH